ncbi:MAG: glycosyl hydrolase [Pseudomonadota bacterium]
MTTAPSPSRRAFFRGALSGRAEERGWHHVDGLAAGAGDVFWAGWADEQGVFVIGDEGAIFHFDGREWHRQAAPAPVPLHAVWGTARDRLWAVGWMGLILSHDGTDWHQVRGCVVGGNGKYTAAPENTPLFAIDGLPDGRAWAVGDRGLILHFDGAAWIEEASGTRAHLRCVTCLDDGRVLAAGSDGTVLERATDGSWARRDCSVASNFTAVLPLGAHTVLLAGGRYFVDANGFRGDLVLYGPDGARRLFDGQAFTRFRALAYHGDAIITVGDGGKIHRIDDLRLRQVASGTQHDLLGIVGLPGNEAMIVGDFGTVLVGAEAALSTFAPAVATGEAPSRWQAMPSGTDRQLWGLWADRDGGSLYACGEEGTVLTLDRGRWEALPPPGNLGVHALERAPDGGLLAAGQLGEIHHFDGTTWRKQFDLLMDITLLSLWSDGQGSLVAAGDEGLVLSWDGADWHRMPSGTRSALFGLWGLDAEHLLAVGDFGLVLRWNGRTWDSFNAGTEHFLFDVWGRGLDDIYVVGLSGTIGHFNGQRWTITPARARKDLLAVVGTQASVVTVGANGIAMVHEQGGWALDETGHAEGLRTIAVGQDGCFYAAGDGGLILRRDPVGGDQ